MKIITKIYTIIKQIRLKQRIIESTERKQQRQSERFLKALWRACPSYEMAEMIPVYEKDKYSWSRYKYLKNFFKIDHEKCWKEYMKFGWFYKKFEDYGRNYNRSGDEPRWGCVDGSVSHSVQLHLHFMILKRFCRCNEAYSEMMRPRDVLSHLKKALKQYDYEMKHNAQILVDTIEDMKKDPLKIVQQKAS